MIRNLALAAVLLFAVPAAAQDTPKAEVSLTRLDCGRANAPWPMAAFSDTGSLDEVRKELIDSCYLIRHGDQLMLWDTGVSKAMAADPENGFLLDRTLIEQLADLRIALADIDYLGISHYHYDHVGQLQDFPNAKLLIGRADWAALTADPPLQGSDPKNFAPWITGESVVETFALDKDVFGDGSVVILAMPGHTPGHHSLLVRLKNAGPIMLSGDLWHLTDNFDDDGVPRFNTSRAETLASFDRFKKLAANLGATIIIQHEAADLNKLPAFPEAAR